MKMAYSIVDRRETDKGKSTVNRQRFIKRARKQLLPGIREAIKDMDIKDISSKDTKKIKVPIRNLDEPTFTEDRKKGVHDYIKTGNDQWHAGDMVRKPRDGEGDGEGGPGSPDGEGDDEFVFTLSKEEFQDLFFEDLELPNIMRDKLALLEETKLDRDGFRKHGPPSSLNVIRTIRKSKIRKSGLRGPTLRKLEEAEQELAKIVSSVIQLTEQHTNEQDETMKLVINQQVSKLILEREEVEKRIELLKQKLENIPFIDTNDLQYNAWEEFQVPTFQAVMVCIMDVSGSMDEDRKKIAKIFFMLLYMFLFANYEKVEIVYIRHHSTAKETNEHDFFHDTDTGGTVVSTALDLAKNILETRYPTNTWNIYFAHASDGDNWSHDNDICHKLLDQNLLPVSQYYAYLDVAASETRQSGGMSFGVPTAFDNLWDMFKSLKKKHENLEQVETNDATKVYDVFRKLFERKSTIKVRSL